MTGCSDLCLHLVQPLSNTLGSVLLGRAGNLVSSWIPESVADVFGLRLEGGAADIAMHPHLGPFPICHYRGVEQQLGQALGQIEHNGLYHAANLPKCRLD